MIPSHGLVFLEFPRAQASSQTKAVYYLVLPLLVSDSQNQGIYDRGEPPRLLPKHLSTTSGLSTCKRLPSPSQNSNTHFSSTRIPLSLNSQSRGSVGHLIAKPLTLFPLFFSVCSLWPVHKFLQVRDHDSHFFWTPEHPAWKQTVIRKNDLVSLKTISNWN